MHRTLKQDVRVARSWRAQQRELDRFRQDFNHVRPHEALNMQTPAAVYGPSPRPYPERLPEVQYPDGMELRAVTDHGYFSWKGKHIFLTEVLWGEPIGLLPLGGNLFHIYFANRPLAGFDAGRGTVVDINHPGWRKIKDKNLPGNQKLSGIRPV
jgi:putative transposase